MSRQSPLVILGGGSLVADYLIPRLPRSPGDVHIVSRQAGARLVGMTCAPFADFEAGVWHVPDEAKVISLLPLPVLIPLLPRILTAKTVIALGSTRRFTASSGDDPSERTAAQALIDAEVALIGWCEQHGIRCTILRPTLIYDMQRDLNLARMAGFVRRFGVLPLASPAKGLRQPIHADDVAKAIVGVLENPAAANRCFNIAGGEQLTYRAMAERVFASLGRRPRLLMLPVGILALGFRVAGRLGLIASASFGSSVFRRMNEHQVFEVEDGLRALGYDPRPFDPRV